MSRKQPYRSEIEESWVESLLHVPPCKGTQPTVYTRLMLAQHEWAQALTEAREVLAANPLMKTVAEAVARKSNKRGDAVLLLDDSGRMFLEVQYKNMPDPTEPRRKWESHLPSLGALQEEAGSLGIDTTPFGRSKTLLAAAIESERTKRTPKPKMMRTAPAIGPITVINPTPKDETPEQPN